MVLSILKWYVCCCFRFWEVLLFLWGKIFFYFSIISLCLFICTRFQDSQMLVILLFSMHFDAFLISQEYSFDCFYFPILHYLYRTFFYDKFHSYILMVSLRFFSSFSLLANNFIIISILLTSVRSDSVMVSKLDKQNFTSESYWVLVHAPSSDI